MQRLEVGLGERSYPILVGEGLLTQAQATAALQACAAGRRCLLVSDAHVAPLYADAVAAALGAAPARLARLVLPAGEAAKTLQHFGLILEHCADAGLRRDDLLIVLGGGVIGDLAGFAAASYMRGIDFVQVPTTLLAMVDSSVGGKTGLNLAAGKNLAGAFWQPRLVLADIATLSTLDEREYRAGLAEVVKYAAIADAALFEWIEQRAPAIRAREPALVVELVLASCRHKAAIVARDERESGERALLNFGHTFGHALEAALDYRGLLHGEAVAIGMLQAARLSSALGMAPAADAARLQALLLALGLPVQPPALPLARLEQHMALDKKASRSGLRFILWQGIGQARIVSPVDPAAVRAVLCDSGALAA